MNRTRLVIIIIVIVVIAQVLLLPLINQSSDIPSLKPSRASSTDNPTKNSNLSPGAKCTIGEDGSDPCTDPYFCTNGKCVHKNIFPDFRPTEMIGSVLIMIIIGLSNAGGVGGSSFVIPIFIFFFGYTANEAVRVTYAVVFGGLFASIFLKASLREPKYQRPVIIYDIVAICVPLLVLGAKFGTIANSVAPEICTVLSVWIISVIVLKNMWENIKKSIQKDREDQTTASQNKVGRGNSKNSFDSIEKLESKKLISGKQELTHRAPESAELSSKTTIKHIFESENDTGFEISENLKLKLLLKKETRLLPWEIYAHFIIYLISSFLLQAINGSKGSPSIIGISYCSMTYWLIFCLNIVLCVLFWGIGVYLIKEKDKNRIEAGMDMAEEYRISLPNIWRLSLIALGTGLIGGMIGLGGCLLFVPLLLTLGIPPLRATSTASFMAIFTSATSLFVTVIGKKIAFNDALFLLGIAFVGSTVIANPIVYLTKKYNRTSILTIILFGLLFIDLIYYPAYEVWRLTVAREETTAFAPIC